MSRRSRPSQSFTRPNRCTAFCGLRPGLEPPARRHNRSRRSTRCARASARWRWPTNSTAVRCSRTASCRRCTTTQASPGEVCINARTCVARGSRSGLHGHPVPSDLVAWAATAGSSPVAFVQPGDSAAIFAVPGYRYLKGHAIDRNAFYAVRTWASSPTVAPNGPSTT